MARILTFDQKHDGFNNSIAAGMRLGEAGVTLIQGGYHDISLGLFQLGQEESGKSFSLLASFAYPDDVAVWKGFWKSWRNHEAKSARSFFYEWFCPARIVLDRDDVRPRDGDTIRGRRTAEKETAFYVDFDDATGSFKMSLDNVSVEEAYNRAMSMLSHLIIATQIGGALDSRDASWRYGTFGELPTRVMGPDFVPQERMPELMEEMASRSPRHHEVISDVQRALDIVPQELELLVQDARRGRTRKWWEFWR